MAGRTTTKWIRFIVDDSTGVPREIPIDSISVVGFIYDEVDITAWQDKVKGYLANHAECNIDITGPFDNDAVQLIAASGDKPVLSGSYPVLGPVNAPTFTTPLGLYICIGDRKYWVLGDPVFGIPIPTATSGYTCTKFNIEGEKYRARFVCDPSNPEWVIGDVYWRGFNILDESGFHILSENGEKMLAN
jgi:hypothetical protein